MKMKKKTNKMCENKKSLKMITKSQSSSNKYPHIAKVKLFE